MAVKSCDAAVTSIKIRHNSNLRMDGQEAGRTMRTIKERTFTGTRDTAMTAREKLGAAAARKAAAEGIVLLKNENGILPLSAGSEVALFGVGASRTVKGGTGSGDVNQRYCVSICDGLKNAGYRITTQDWIRDLDEQYEKARTAWRDDILSRTEGENTAHGFFAVYTTTPFVMPAGGPVTATTAKTAFYVISRVAGEGADRYAKEGDYYLSPAEAQQLADTCRFYEHVIVVLNTGGVVDLSFMDRYPNIEALLQISQGGMEAGNAFADVISGKVTPSGKLTDTWAYHYEDYPSSKTFSHNDGNVEKAYYTDGIFVGYRYFDTFGVPVRYGFGEGLSYTQFKIDCTGVGYDQGTASQGALGQGAASQGAVGQGEAAVTISFTVANTGEHFAGKEVIQVYVTSPFGGETREASAPFLSGGETGEASAPFPSGGLPREFRSLVGFTKTRTLAPGEEETVSIRIPLKLLAAYDPGRPGWLLTKGEYVFWAGNSLRDSTPAAIVTLDEEVLLEKTQNICPLREELEEIHPGAGATDAARRRVSEASGQSSGAVLRSDLPVCAIHSDEIPLRTVSYQPGSAFTHPEAAHFTAGLTTDQLIALASGDPAKAQGGDLGSAGISVPGSAGETSRCAQDQGLASIVLADGPAGLRLTQSYNVHEGRIVSRPFECNLEGGIFDRRTTPDPGETYYQYCTAIPVGTALAQTWNTQLLREIGEVIAGEMETFGVTLWLAPGMNIHRDPLCGRNFEYYSEDPVLSGYMAAAITDGVQSVPGCGTTIKHLACNNQEDNRMHCDSIVSERALREIYLRGFEIAVRTSQPLAIMSSYNLINGIHAANHADLCTKAARCEWGFEGLIMTDWTTTQHGDDCTASGCIRAGNDLIMPGAFSDAENLRSELAAGTLKEEDLRSCISRIIHVILNSNQYEK